jgi:hypothetical protein
LIDDDPPPPLTPPSCPCLCLLDDDLDDDDDDDGDRIDFSVLLSTDLALLDMFDLIDLSTLLDLIVLLLDSCWLSPTPSFFFLFFFFVLLLDETDPTDLPLPVIKSLLLPASMLRNGLLNLRATTFPSSSW